MAAGRLRGGGVQVVAKSEPLTECAKPKGTGIRRQKGRKGRLASMHPTNAGRQLAAKQANNPTNGCPSRPAGGMRGRKGAPSLRPLTLPLSLLPPVKQCRAREE